MYLGEIIESANTEDLFKKPLHPYTEALIKSIPIPSTNQKGFPFTISGDIPSMIDKPNGCNFHPRCKYAEKICRTTHPSLIKFHNNHSVACHLYNKLNLTGI